MSADKHSNIDFNITPFLFLGLEALKSMGIFYPFWQIYLELWRKWKLHRAMRVYESWVLQNASYKIFVFVLPKKKGLADGAPPIPLLVWHQLYRFVICSLQRLYCKVYRCLGYRITDYKSVVTVLPKEGLAGPNPPANTSFGMTMTKIFEDTFFVANASYEWQREIYESSFFMWRVGSLGLGFCWNS